MRALERILIVAAGLFGCAGVAASAAAAHLSYAYLDIVGPFLLMHAAALAGIVALCAALPAPPRTLQIAGAAIALGTLLFCGDLALRGTVFARPIPMAAPAGGMLTLAGWLLLAISGLIAGRRPG